MPKGEHLSELNRRRRIQIIGLRFGKLVVIREDGKKKKQYTYLCRCDCGLNRNNVPGDGLRRGKIKSCGCDFSKYQYRGGDSLEDYFEHHKQVLITRRRIVDGCWEYTGILNNKGYGWKSFGRGKDRGKWVVHRIAYTIWKGEIPSGYCVLHSCDNTACFNPDHLWLGTQKDNMNDKARKGRCHNNQGSKSGMSKLEETQVLEIRRLRNEGNTLKMIAEKFNVTEANISDICQRHTWRHV
jgi:hypothetical protein